jgi:hypothetical protein
LDLAILQTAWASAWWARAGELITYTTSGVWSDKDITQFESMLRNVDLPFVKNGDIRASNWDVGERPTENFAAQTTDDSQLKYQGLVHTG